MRFNKTCKENSLVSIIPNDRNFNSMMIQAMVWKKGSFHTNTYSLCTWKEVPSLLYPPDGEHKQLIWRHRRTPETLLEKSALHEISTPCRHTPSPSAVCTITKHLYNWSSSQWIYYYLSSKSHSRQSKHAPVKQGSHTQKYFQKYEKHFYFLFKNLALR